MIITVGGLIGSGKSTLGKGLADKYDMVYISAGEIMREKAEEKNMTLQEFSEYAEKHPEVDKEIDELQVDNIEENCVVDGRLAAHFITEAELRIWLTSSLEVRTSRVASREGISVREAEKRINAREKSERKRYKEIYDIDLDNLDKYDLVINTGIFNIKATSAIVSKAVEHLKI